MPDKPRALPPRISDARMPLFEKECEDFFSEAGRVFRLPASIGAIYGLLFASAAPLRFSDIVDRLEISKGSASQGIRWLRDLGAIKLVEAPVAKKAARDLAFAHCEYFVPELSLRVLMAGILHERVAPLISAGSEHFERVRELAKQGGDDSEFYLSRLRQMETWRKRLKALLPMLTVMLGPRKRG